MHVFGRVVLAASLLGVFTGCSPGWKVLRVSGPPSALTAVDDVAVAFDYGQLVVEGRPEANWVEVKTAEDPKYPETWADLKRRFEGAVLAGVRAHYPQAHSVESGQGQAVMVVRPRTFQLGKFNPFVLPPTVMDVVVAWDVGGQITDEIALTRSYPSSITAPSVFNHIGPVGEAIGRAGGAFLSSKRGK